MRARGLIIFAAAVAVLALAAVFMSFSARSPVPPVLRLANVERAGIMDDEGNEMWLVTLSVSNANPALSGRGGVLFVKNEDRMDEAKTDQNWTDVERPWVEGHLQTQIRTFDLSPGMDRERLLLLPANARSCRISLTYTYAVTSYRTRIATALRRTPRWIRSRVPFKMWRWAGLDLPPLPGTDWHEVSAELPFAAGAPK